MTGRDTVVPRRPDEQGSRGVPADPGKYDAISIESLTSVRQI
jgi:hypothetical protein